MKLLRLVTRNKHATGLVILLLIVMMAARPLPNYEVQPLALPTVAAEEVSFPWPDYGQAAIGATGFDVIGTSGSQEPRPIASITKLITAMVVLDKYPIALGEKGGDIKISSNDIALYPYYLSRGGTVVEVREGETISQYDAIAAMMVPSANNISDSVAIWAYGSIDNYITAAKKYLSKHGYDKTSVADASGFSPHSVSTPSELVRLGIEAMQDPVLATIVGQSQFVLGWGPTVNSTNRLLGTDGYVGIKTGNTAEAGGCYLFAAKRIVNNEELMLVGAITGAPNLSRAQQSSRSLVNYAANHFKKVRLLNDGQVVAKVHSAWGTSGELVAKKNSSMTIWTGTGVSSRLRLKPLNAEPATGTDAGSLVLNSGSMEQDYRLVVKEKLVGPSLLWRILR